MSFKDIPYLQLWEPLCLVEQNNLCNFGGGHYGEHFCKIILNMEQWFRRCHLKGISYLQLWQSFRLAEQDHLCNFSREHYEEHFCVVILNLVQWLRRRCCLNILLFLDLVAIFFFGAKPFVQFR